MTLLNQAALGLWYNFNNSPKWRFVITLLYSVVNDGMGTTLINNAIFTNLFYTTINSADKFAQSYLQNNPPTSA